MPEVPGVITLPDGSERPLNFRPSQPDWRKGAALFTGLLLVLFIWSAWKVNQQAVRVNEQANQIHQIIDDQSPLVFAFENAGATGRVTFVVTCERKEGQQKYTCITDQTSPVQAQLTPVPTPSLTASPTPTR